MRRIGIILAIVSSLMPGTLDAHCRVQCRQVAVVEAVVATPYAVAVGIPYAQTVATYSPVSYQYTPQAQPQPVIVNNYIDSNAIADKVAAKLNGPPPDQQPQLPNPPAVPNSAPPVPEVPKSVPQSPVPPQPPPPPQPRQSTAVQTNCLSCHSQAGNSPKKAQALAKINLENIAALSCEQRLACVRGILSGEMPMGHKLDAEEAGRTLEEIVGQK